MGKTAIENPMLEEESEGGVRVAAGEDHTGGSRLSPKVVAGAALGGVLLVLLTVLAVALGSGGSEDAGGAAPAAAAAPTQNVLELVGSLPELSTLFTAIGETRITALFALQGNLTVFAPTNAAFEALSPITRERIFDPANIDERSFCSSTTSARRAPSTPRTCATTTASRRWRARRSR
jgi:hypothetical protein